ncbi:MAG: hypothetical protein ACRDHZ_00145 [Ktedonobacteraceae bacterium]
MQALEKAHALLAEHRLSIEEIEPERRYGVCPFMVPEFDNKPWIKITVAAICKLYYCELLIDSKNKTLAILGTSENAGMAANIGRWIVDVLERESKSVYKTGIQRRSFLLGASHKIGIRVVEMLMREVEIRRDAGSFRDFLRGLPQKNQLIALRNKFDRLNRDFVDEVGIGKSDQRKVEPGDYMAYETGKEFGKQLGLNRQIEAKK